ncbi:Helicase [Hexamita inflata]|uniref:Helicase n=1 Tax=Hexamita inflata TaxID=28002 RepID=A0AA86TTV2_9EUKA|nr:Helicase [Hexamita inflata]
MSDYDIFEDNAEKIVSEQRALPVVVDVAQPEQADKRKNVRHSVVFPPTMKQPENPLEDIYQLPPPTVMARQFPFTLDPFQQKAISALNRGESVLVSAHTSAGKTVIAEYGIALCLQKNQKIVYTSPIKALSNQKYRDLTVTYSENKDLVNGQKTTIGLMTGDTTVNRNAQVLVMTTEILRNMLHSGAEVLREIGCVVFDEVHYMKNAERGLVWEDCLSLLDSKINFVFLSATIPNASEFAAWVSQIHQKPVHVIYTEFRPVPLQFMICPLGAQQAFQVFSSDTRVVNNEQVNKAIQALPFQSSHSEMKMSKGKNQKKLTSDTVVNMLRMLIMKNIYPVIVFSFGKAKCEELAVLAAKIPNLQNLLTKAQMDTVDAYFDAALLELPEEDRQLKQIQSAKELLRRGIAVHHSGLLPFVKEITEILFQEDLVKIIFVTETFAMGLNLPARCVIFSELKKFDGQEQRYVQSGEFIQMAGRAGRRGLDTQGVVITLFSDADDCQNALQIMQGTAEPLNSAYRLNYGSIINLIRTEGVSPEIAINKSFLQFQKEFRLPRCERELESIRYRLDFYSQQISNEHEDVNLEHFTSYLELEKLLSKEQNQLQLMLLGEQNLSNYLQPGRIVEVFAENQNFSYGIVVQQITFSGQSYVDVLVPVQTSLQLEQRGAEPLVTLMNNFLKDYKFNDEFVKVLLEDASYSSFVQKKVTGESVVSEEVDNLIFVKQNTDLKEEDMKQAEHAICTQYIQKARIEKNELAQNDILTYCATKLMRTEEHLKSSSSIKLELQAIKNNKLIDEENFKPCIVRVNYSGIKSISTKFLKKLPTSLAKYDDRKQLLNTFATAIEQLMKARLLQITEEQPNLRGVHLLNELYVNRHKVIPKMPLSNVEGVNPQIIQQQERVDKLNSLLQTQFKAVHNILFQFNPETANKLTNAVLTVQKLAYQQNILINTLKNSQMVLQLELTNMKKVLQDLNYINQTQILEKGKLACQINAANELILTEAIFNNLFGNATPEVFAGIVCSIIGDSFASEFSAVSEPISPYLQLIKNQTQDLIRACSIHNTQLDQYITKTEDIINELCAELAFQWASGASLTQICEIDKNLFEGNIVRMLRRLVTVLQQLEEASGEWGGGEISRLCAEAIVKVNRGIVKADSLYIVEEQPVE